MICFYFLVAKDDRTMTSGWQGTPYFRSYGREGAGFKTGDFVEEELGGLYRRTTPTCAYILLFFSEYFMFFFSEM